MSAPCPHPLPTHPKFPGRLRFETCDPRADNRRRVIDVERDRVTIRRAVAGVHMAIRVSASAYRGVGLRVAALEEGRFRYEIRLLHRDRDLSVSLAEGYDQKVIEDEWRAWVGFLRLPALVERIEGAETEVSLEGSGLVPRKPPPRRRGLSTVSRRPRFLRRRKVGRVVLVPTVHSNPQTLFPGSKFGR